MVTFASRRACTAPKRSSMPENVRTGSPEGVDRVVSSTESVTTSRLGERAPFLGALLLALDRAMLPLPS